MSKAIAFVVGYSIFLLVLFSVMCYLMTTVNPPPLQDSEPNKANDSRRYFNLDFKPLFPNELEEGDNAEYGLEKVDDDFIPQNPLSFYIQNGRQFDKVIAPDTPGDVRVSPPIFPLLPDSHKLNTLGTTDVHGSIGKERLRLEAPFIKGHRRSVKKTNIDSKVGTVVFKVLHDSGRPRTEMKFGDITAKNFTINKFKRKSKLNKSMSYYNEAKGKTVLSENSVFKIMPNDTLIIYDDDNSVEMVGKDFKYDSREVVNSISFVEASTKKNTNVTIENKKNFTNTGLPKSPGNSLNSTSEVPKEKKPNYQESIHTAATDVLIVIKTNTSAFV